MGRWTPEETETLIRMAKGKRGGVDIAVALGKSKRAVYMRLYRLNLRIDPEAANECRTRVVRSKEVARKSGASGWTPERRAMSARVARERCAHILERINNDPEYRAQHAARMKALGAAKTAWCPPHLMRRYVSLRSRLGAEAARKQVMAEHAEQEAARLAKLTPFERQLERVKAGARLETRVARPANDLGYSPIGCALAL